MCAIFHRYEIDLENIDDFWQIIKIINLIIILGDFCTDSKNAVGRCTPFDLCAGVHSTIYNYDTRPILCGFKGNTPVVCCTSENLGLPPDKVVPKKVGDLALERN